MTGHPFARPLPEVLLPRQVGAEIGVGRAMSGIAAAESEGRLSCAEAAPLREMLQGTLREFTNGCAGEALQEVAVDEAAALFTTADEAAPETGESPLDARWPA